MSPENVNRQRVVVTGLGLLSPLGSGVEETVAALRSGACGLSLGDATKELPHFWSDTYGVVRGFAPEKYIEDRRSIRNTTRGVHLAISAARLAVDDAGWAATGDEEDFSSGVVIAMAMEDTVGEVLNVWRASTDAEGRFSYRLCGEKGASRMPPLYILPRLPNTAAGQIAISHKIRGLNFSVVNGANGGALAIHEAYRIIRSGHAQMVVTGGCSAPLGPVGVHRNELLKLFDLTQRGSSPFSAGAKGYIPAEGAAMLVLESEASAQARGARIYAEVSGGANLYNPRPGESESLETESYVRLIRATLRSADLSPRDVSAVNANGLSMPLQDAAECASLREAFGTECPPISATKSQTGYLETASGALEACVSALSVKLDFVPPTIRLHDPLRGFDFTASGPHRTVNHVLSTNYDTKGSLCGLVFSKYVPRAHA